MIMRAIRQLQEERRQQLSPKVLLAVTFALMVCLAWLPAPAAQPSSQGHVLHLDARGLDLLLQSDPNLLLIDVRTPGELTGPLGRIPQSRNVSMQEIENNPEQLPRDKTLVLICRSGHRSLKAAELLAGHGYVVYSVDGGMRTWRDLHPQAEHSVEGAQPKGPGAPGHTPDTAKPLPRENGGQNPPEKFFDTNMGC